MKATWLGGLKAQLCQSRRRHIGYSRLQFAYEKPMPAGHLPVYVGEGRERFVIPAAFLSHPLFSILLEKAYQEHGFKHKNGLQIPCNVSVFENVLAAIKRFHGQFDFEKLTEKCV